MKLIDFENLTFTNFRQGAINTMKLEIKYDDILNEPADKMVRLLRKEFDNLIKVSEVGEPTYFKIHIKDNKIEKTEYEFFANAVANIFFDALVDDKPRNREARLDVPSQLYRHYLCGKAHIMDCINKQMHYDVFGGEIMVNEKKFMFWK